MIGRYTLAGTVARLGAQRVQQAIDDQRHWLGCAKHSELAAEFYKDFAKWPRFMSRSYSFGLHMAGFKSGLDIYLFKAYALGKLKSYGIR